MDPLAVTSIPTSPIAGQKPGTSGLVSLSVGLLLK